MTVQDSINRWGFIKLTAAGKPVPVGTHITLVEDLPSSNFCKTCGPGPIRIIISGAGERLELYMSMGEVIAEMLEGDRA